MVTYLCWRWEKNSLFPHCTSVGPRIYISSSSLLHSPGPGVSRLRRTSLVEGTRSRLQDREGKCLAVSRLPLCLGCFLWLRPSSSLAPAVARQDPRRDPTPWLSNTPSYQFPVSNSLCFKYLKRFVFSWLTSLFIYTGGPQQFLSHMLSP